MYSGGCKPDKGTGTEKRRQAEQKLRATGDIITAASRIKATGTEKRHQAEQKLRAARRRHCWTEERHRTEALSGFNPAIVLRLRRRTRINSKRAVFFIPLFFCGLNKNIFTLRRRHVRYKRMRSGAAARPGKGLLYGRSAGRCSGSAEPVCEPSCCRCAWKK